jgi:Domain of unknown function (DUF6321)
MAVRKAAKTRDPKGGLTAAGRAEFKRKQGSNLKPGVKKTMSEMTPDEMRRKGSWAARFYGRETLPPLTDRKASRPASRSAPPPGASRCRRPRPRRARSPPRASACSNATAGLRTRVSALSGRRRTRITA